MSNNLAYYGIFNFLVKHPQSTVSTTYRDKTRSWCGNCELNNGRRVWGTIYTSLVSFYSGVLYKTYENSYNTPSQIELQFCC